MNMQILWLASWYPNKIAPFEGDFIQRHAKAAALFDDIQVLHVCKVMPQHHGQVPAETFYQNGKSCEQILYNKSGKIPLISDIFSLFTYFKLHRRAIKKYIDEKGIPDIVHVHVPVKSGVIAIWMRWKYAVPIVLTEHYTIYNETEPDRFHKRSLLFRFVTRKIVTLCEKFLPVSAQLGNAVNKYVAKKSFEVVPNTVDIRHFHFSKVPEGRFRFIHISNMVARKNVPGIIDAVEKLADSGIDFELVLVGEINPEIERTVSGSPTLSRRVIFTGEIIYEEVALQLHRSHCLLLFSHAENLPCVILEALCCGRTVISTATGGIPEVVDASNGILVADNDTDALVGAMKNMIENYEGYDIQGISDNACSRFSYETIGNKLHGIYAGLGS